MASEQFKILDDGTNLTTLASATTQRVDSALTTAFPSAIHVLNDIYVAGKSDSFLRDLRAALETRGLLTAIVCRPLTFEQIQLSNPGASPTAVQICYDSLMADRARRHKMAAAQLPRLLLGLTLSESKAVNDLAQADDAPALYEFIHDLVDLTQGKAQDRVQAKYAEVHVTSSDSYTAVAKAIEMKWYLFSLNNLFSKETEAGVRVGIRHVNKMLVKGPLTASANASLGLTQVDHMQLPPGGGDQWAADLAANYFRYAEDFDQSSLHGANMGMSGYGGGGNNGFGGNNGGTPR